MSIFSNPLFIFILVWLVPLIVLMNHEIIGYGLNWSDPVVSFIIINILLFSINYVLVSVILPHKKNSGRKFVLCEKQITILEKYLNKIFKYWCVCYLIIIIISGGFPLLWIIIGDTKNYVDFGVPTFSGLLNMVRAFLVASFGFIIFKSKVSRRKAITKVFFLIISAFVFELARGNGTFMLMHFAAMYLMTCKLKPKKFLIAFTILISFLIVGSSINAVRYGQGADYLIKQAVDYGLFAPDSSILLVVFVPVVVYLCLPIVNLNYKLEHLPEISFELYYLLQGFVPTFIRNVLFSAADYGLIVDPAHNVSSFYDPIVRDLGSIFCYGFLSFFYFAICLIYIGGRRGNQFLFFLYPAIFASLVLSFFSMYFLTLVVLLYPIPVYFWIKFTKKIIQNSSSRDDLSLQV